MNARDFRKQAREDLKGKWGKAILILLAYILFSWVIGFVMGLFETVPVVAFIIEILYFLISIPLEFAILVQYLRLSNGDDVKAFDFVKWSFANFKKSWKVTFSIIKKLLVPMILLIVCIVLIIFSISSIFVGIISESVSLDSFELSAQGAASIMNSLGLFIIGLIGYIVCLVWLIVKGYYYSLVGYIMDDNSELTAKEIVNKSEEMMTDHRWKLFCLGFSFIGWMILSIFTFGIGLIFLLPYMQMASVAFYKERAGKLNKAEDAVVVEE